MAGPGNIRELENLVKRYVIVGNEAQIVRELSLRKPAVSVMPGIGSEVGASGVMVIGDRSQAIGGAIPINSAKGNGGDAESPILAGDWKARRLVRRARGHRDAS